MSWARDAATALQETFDGVLDDLVLGVGATGDGTSHVEVRPGEHADGRFEVGSIGKTFTSLVLACDVVEGRVALDDPIGTWLDAGDNGDITLLDLATHTSGLPRLAPNASDWEGFDEADPYAGYTAVMAEEALRGAERSAEGFSYSNFGFQLLGLALERIGGAPIGERLGALVFEPLGMTGAGVTGTTGDPVQGHGQMGEPTAAWSELHLPGPGGYEATAADMVRYASAVLDPPAGSLGEAIELTVGPHVDSDQGQHGLGWHHHPEGLVWHNGGTGGFHSMLALDRDNGRGAVALANHTDFEHLDAAVMRAVLDRDVRALRPEPADDSWVEEARPVAEAVVANDWEAVRACSNEALAGALTDVVLQSGWDEVFGPRGEHRSTTVARATRSDGSVRVTFQLDHAEGRGQLLVWFDEDGCVNGLRIF